MRLYLVSLSLSLSLFLFVSEYRESSSTRSFRPRSLFFFFPFLLVGSGWFFFFNRVFSSGSYGVYRVSYRIFCGIQSQFLRGLRPSSFFFRAAHVSSLSVSSSFTVFFSVLYRVVVVVATDLLRCVLFPAIWWQRGALLRELRFLFFHFFVLFSPFSSHFVVVVVVVVSVSFSGCAAALPERRFIGQRSDGLRFN